MRRVDGERLCADQKVILFLIQYSSVKLKLHVPLKNDGPYVFKHKTCFLSEFSPRRRLNPFAFFHPAARREPPGPRFGATWIAAPKQQHPAGLVHDQKSCCVAFLPSHLHDGESLKFVEPNGPARGL